MPDLSPGTLGYLGFAFVCLVAAGFFVFGVKGSGGIFSKRRRTSSSLGRDTMKAPMPKHVEMQFYHVIGGIVIRYGFIDSLVAEAARILFEELGGHSSQKHPVRPMSVRLEYIGKCLRNKPELASLTSMGEEMIGSVKNLDGMRQFLIHGMLTEYFPVPGLFQFTKLDPNDSKTGYEQESMAFSQAQLAEMANLCTEVVRGLTWLGKELQAVAAAKKGQ